MSGVRVNWHGDEMDRELRTAIGELVDLTTTDLQREITVTLSRPGTGREYRVARGQASGNLRQRGIHRASAPGQPPAADTGTLRRSWQQGGMSNIDESDGVGTSANPTKRLGSNLPYARFLEYGTMHIAPRPYVRSSVETVRTRVPQLARAVMNRMIERINNL